MKTAEEIRAYHKAYYLRNKARILGQVHRWNDANRDRISKNKKQWRLRNPTQNALSKKAHISKRRTYVRVAKDSPCADCGKHYPHYVMQFDHLRDKTFNLSKAANVSFARIQSELAKCELVCANCHAERTHQRRITLAQSGRT